MSLYVVYRHRWNETNQRRKDGVPEVMPVLRVNADSAEAACSLAGQTVPVEPGQHLSAQPASAVDAHEAELNRTARADEALETESESV